MSTITGIVYRISHKYLPITYIGSTTMKLSTRFSAHKTQYRQYKRGTRRGRNALFFYFDAHGTNSFDIYEIAKYNCESRTQLRLMEQIFMNKIKNINLYDAYRQISQKEYLYKYRRDPKNKQKQRERKQKQIAIKLICYCGSQYSYGCRHNHYNSKNHKKFTDLKTQSTMLMTPNIVYTPHTDTTKNGARIAIVRKIQELADQRCALQRPRLLHLATQ